MDGARVPDLLGPLFASSVFFYAADCIRALSGSEDLQAAWPRPSLGELQRATTDFCSRHWAQLPKTMKQGGHKHTPMTKLKNRCFQANYVAALLGPNGLRLSSSARNVTFGARMNGEPAEWPLGALLSELRRLQPAPKHAEEVDVVVCRMHRTRFGMLMVYFVLSAACIFQVTLSVFLRDVPIFSARADEFFCCCGGSRRARRYRYRYSAISKPGT